MKSGDVITLANNSRYFIIDELDYEEKDYVLAIGLYDNNDFDYTDILFFEKYYKNDKLTVKKVNDEKIIEKLLLIMIADIEIDEDKDDYLLNALQDELNKYEKGSN